MRRIVFRLPSFGFTLTAVLAIVSLPASAQTGAKNGEWPSYGGDLGNTRYSPLDQINAAQFQQARRSPGDSRPTTSARGRSSTSKATPLMVERRALLDRRNAARRGGARCGHRRAAVDARRERRRARRGRAAAALRPRPGVLDRRPRRAHPLRHARLSPDRAECQDRRAGPELRQERHRRSEAGRRSGDRSGHRRSRAARGAGGRERRRDRRRRASLRRRAARARPT